MNTLGTVTAAWDAKGEQKEHPQAVATQCPNGFLIPQAH